MADVIYVDCFTEGLDELPRRKQSNPVEVLRLLHKAGRFSVFEATANETIARMMDRLMNKGCSIVKDGVRTDYGKLLENTGGAFPWTTVRLTEGGLRLLAEHELKP